MATDVIRYATDHETRWGVLDGANVQPVAGEYPGTSDFIAGPRPR